MSGDICTVHDIEIYPVIIFEFLEIAMKGLLAFSFFPETPARSRNTNSRRMLWYCLPSDDAMHNKIRGALTYTGHPLQVFSLRMFRIDHSLVLRRILN